MANDFPRALGFYVIFGSVLLGLAGCQPDPELRLENRTLSVVPGESLMISTSVTNASPSTKIACTSDVGDCEVLADGLSAKLTIPPDTESQVANLSIRLMQGDRNVQTTSASVKIARPALTAAPSDSPPSHVAPTPPAQTSRVTAALASVAITNIPPAVPDGSDTSTEPIGGTATGITNLSDYRIVLYTYTNRYYIQPTLDDPYTPIDQGGAWSADIHPGKSYCAMLVKSTYVPAGTLSTLPRANGVDVLAVTRVVGKPQ